jgi:hypothetical protein
MIAAAMKDRRGIAQPRSARSRLLEDFWRKREQSGKKRAIDRPTFREKFA